MKKSLVTIIALVLTIGLTACAPTAGGDTQSDKEENIGSKEDYGGKESSFGGSLSDFSAEDMEGNQVTQDVFANYDLTMVNLWTTWCGYCIDEMPELQEVYNNLPDNANLITICGDADQEAQTAEQILNSVGAEFQTLVANEELNNNVLSHIRGVPTTIFVDKDGKVVGEPQVGVANGKDGVAQAYLEIIQNRLDLLD